MTGILNPWRRAESSYSQPLLFSSWYLRAIGTCIDGRICSIAYLAMENSSGEQNALSGPIIPRGCWQPRSWDQSTFPGLCLTKHQNSRSNDVEGNIHLHAYIDIAAHFAPSQLPTKVWLASRLLVWLNQVNRFTVEQRVSPCSPKSKTNQPISICRIHNGDH